VDATVVEEFVGADVDECHRPHDDAVSDATHSGVPIPFSGKLELIFASSPQSLGAKCDLPDTLDIEHENGKTPPANVSTADISATISHWHGNSLDRGSSGRRSTLLSLRSAILVGRHAMEGRLEVDPLEPAPARAPYAAAGERLRRSHDARGLGQPLRVHPLCDAGMRRHPRLRRRASTKLDSEFDADELFEPGAALVLRRHRAEVDEDLIAFRLVEMWGALPGRRALDRTS
jgi:hypothetical protein